MKAQNLSICIPNRGCNKNCPYCVSKMTGYIETNKKIMLKNLNTLKHFAKQLNVSSVLLTGKGEPLLSNETINDVVFFLKEFESYVTELQTNGITLFKKDYKKILDQLYACNLNIIAFSIDNISDITKNKELYRQIKEDYGFIVRFTLNITNEFKDLSFNEIVSLCSDCFCQQMTIRKITIPNNLNQNKIALNTQNWIEKNIDHSIYDNLITQFIKIKQDNKNIQRIRKLSNGAVVYDIFGVSFTYFDYCLQDENNENDIRSLIFLEDGHAYDNWNSEASILF